MTTRSRSDVHREEGQSSSRALALFVWGLVTGALACGACASSPRVPAAPARETPAAPSDDVDDALRGELVPLTRALLRTGALGESGPREALRLVKDRLDAAGLETEVDRPAGGAESLLARLPGADASLRPLLLVAHADTFPADAAAWRADAPPYDGALVGEHLVGRGALDMHGPLALLTLSLVHLARAEEAPARDVLLLVTTDGEGSGAALRQALWRWPRALAAEHALGEGGLVLEDGLRAGEDVVVVSHGEKGRLLLRLRARGERLPAERAMEPSAPGRLASALTRVVGAHPPREVPEPLLPTARALLEARGGVFGLLSSSEGALSLLAEGALRDEPLGEPLLASTCAVTSLSSGAPTPVVPPWAEAVLDCRLLPGDAPAAFRDRLLLAIDDPRVELEVLDMAPASFSAPEGRVLDVIRERMVQERASIPVLSVMTASKTALGWLRARGIAAYGFMPIRVDRDELAALHGADERVRVKELEDALPRLIDVIAALARPS